MDLQLRQGLAELRANNGPDAVEACLRTLHAAAEKIVHARPCDGDKFRKMKQANTALRRKVTDVPGGLACLLALGFEAADEGGEPLWRLAPSRAAMDALYAGKAEIAQELERLADIPVDAAKRAEAAKPGGIEGMVVDALSNPGKLARALDNPLVRAFVQAQPEMVQGLLASTPALQETLQTYPDMRAQLERVLGRPLALERSPAAQSAAAQAPAQSLPHAPQLSPRSAPTGGGSAEALAMLQTMGFTVDKSSKALRAAGGDLELAVAILTAD